MKLRLSFHSSKWIRITLIFLMVCVTPSLFAQQPMNQLRGGEIQSRDEHLYGKVEVRMYSQPVDGTTSTFFWWRNGGHECGTKWNEIDIETIPFSDAYQSNPIWQESDNDCNQKTSEGLHGDANLYNRWVVYTLEWTPDYIAWYHDGQLDRMITTSNHPSVSFIDQYMRYCFNLWSQGTRAEWLGALDFDSLKLNPVYQFVDYFRYYEWNGNGFNSNTTTNIEFSSASEINEHFHVSFWEFGQSQGFLSWSPNAVGVVDLGNGNGALWLGLFHAGDERAPVGAEIPPSDTVSSNGASGASFVVEAETTDNNSGLRVNNNVLSHIQNGSWATFPPVNIPSSGEYDITYHASSGSDGGTIQLERAGGSEVFGNVTIPPSGGWSNFQDTTHRVTLPTGGLSFGMYIADGGFNLDRFTITARIPAAQPQTIQAEDAIQYSELQVSGSVLGNISNGAWATYRSINIAQAGQYRFTYRVASGGDGGSIQLERAGGSQLFGNVDVPATGGWANFTEISHTVTLPAGDIQFGLYFADGGFRFDKFSFVKVN